MSTWYYAIDGEQFGPVSDQQLHDLAGDGSLHPTDLVWQAGFDNWRPADTLPGLFVTAGSVPPAFADTVVGGHGSDDPQPIEPAAAQSDKTPDDLKVPVLVSGIFNLIFAAGLGLTGCLMPLAIPLVVLACYEIKLFQRADQIPTSEFAAEAKSLAIYEIIVGVFNTPTLICGIILMVQGGKYVDTTTASA